MDLFVEYLDVHGAELRNIVIHVLAADPGTPVEAQLWYNSTDNVLRYFDGTDVIDLSEAGSSAAADITIVDAAGDFVATNVEDALAELQSDAEADATALADHLADTSDAHDASAISFVPGSGIASTNAQAAIEEAKTDATAYTDLHAAAADPHAVYQLESEKGAVNGYASLDGAGRVPTSQLPVSAMEYKGTWNATTNSPALVDGTGSAGDLYRVSTAGTQNLGSGAITFDVGDYVIYNGTTWEKGDTTDAVSSVFSRTGAVTAQVGDYAAFYSRFYADDIGDGSTTPIPVTHSLNTRRVKVEVYRNSTPWDTIICGVERNTVNQVTLDFNGYVPTTDEFTVLVTAVA